MAILSPAWQPNQCGSCARSTRPSSSQSSPTGAPTNLRERSRRAQRRDLHPVNRGQTRAENFRRDEERDAIHDARAERGSGEIRAAFDQDSAPSAMPELEHQAIQLDLAVVGRDRNHFDAAALISIRRARARFAGVVTRIAGRASTAADIRAPSARCAGCASMTTRTGSRPPAFCTSGADCRLLQCPRRPSRRRIRDAIDGPVRATRAS